MVSFFKHIKAPVWVLFFMVIFWLPSEAQLTPLEQAHYLAYCQKVQTIASEKDDAYGMYVKNLSEFLNVFINENNSEFDEYINNSNQRIEVIKAQKSSLLNRFALGEMYFHTALLHIKFKNQTSAARLIKRSYLIHLENYKASPHYQPSHKTLAMIDLLASQIPSKYLWLAKMVGIQADEERAIRLVKGLLDQNSDQSFVGNIALETAYLYGTYLSVVKHQPKLALSITQPFTNDLNANLSSVFFKANFSRKNRDNDLVIDLLSKAPKQGYKKMPMLDLMLGEAFLYQQNAQAITHLKRFLKEYKGINYQKDAHQKMSWYYFISDDKTLGEKYKKGILNVGNLNSELDQKAQKYALSESPDPILLKARLLFDGGYYSEALKVIRPSQAEDFKSQLHKTEYCYRKARIYHALEDTLVAKKFYQATMVLGKDLTAYYASYSALYIGDMLLEQDQNDEAIKYYVKARSFKMNTEYVNSIEIKSRNGVRNARKND